MKLVIAGGSGQIGSLLARTYLERGDEVVVLSRRPVAASWRVVPWDAEHRGDWQAELEGAAAVINLAGRSVDCRYSAQNRKQMLDSRVQSTRAIGRAIAAARRPPPLWLQASTATIYAHRFDAPNDEITGIIGNSAAPAPSSWDFSIKIAEAWEAAATDFALPATRLVLLRAAMVMTPDRGGIFDVLSKLARKGLGGNAGDGRQFVSWIHGQDFIRALDWLRAHPELAGPVNLAAPDPLPYAEFIRALRVAAGVRWGLPSPSWLLEIGAFALRTETELMLKSRRVVPRKLLESGFEFEFPRWPAAAEALGRIRRQATA